MPVGQLGAVGGLGLTPNKGMRGAPPSNVVLLAGVALTLAGQFITLTMGA